MTRNPVTLARLDEMHRAGEQIVMVTAYDYVSGRVAEQAGIDIVLVGDSGAQVVLGYDSTVPVTVDEMLTLAKAVRRAVRTPLIVCDVPFGSTETSDAQAIETAMRFAKEAGAHAVKLEGATEDRLSRIRAIVAAGIPVVAHIGLTPQTATALGGLRAQGRDETSALRFAREALAVQDAGAFALVVEAVPADLVAAILPALRIPVIGIGAGAADGQVLVQHDLLGITEGHTAKFVKQYASLHGEMVAGVTAYADEVRRGAFPSESHTYAVRPEVVETVRAALKSASEK
ncbi:3-methyl-2-oxobutanoate hydroxymethyltransferase [Microbacterium aoyamense]|uniref:3-methyl-2-oxobutanoate hydroxymethyltransferase n=1 Tax=Microbacterium aoyamense TaxID=344166 RepID=A0ABN2Q1G0_9MICO|nr:3-methyl-2-oxobutanoate hydroxymethyltransferase [Microbacterium aoyamense]